MAGTGCAIDEFLVLYNNRTTKVNHLYALMLRF